MDRNVSINNGNYGYEPIGHCIVMKLEETFNCTSYHITANRSKEFCTDRMMGLMNLAKMKMINYQR